MPQQISVPLSTSFLGSSSNVPETYDLAINGRDYMLDLEFNNYGVKFVVESEDFLKPQSDTATVSGQGSINPETAWSRTFESWHLGAGQQYWDRQNSSASRFYSSQGIDPWTKWKVCLLNETTQVKSSSDSNTFLTTTGNVPIVTGPMLYVSEGADIYRTSDLSSWTAITGLPAVDPTSLTSDGTNIYSAHGTSGIYKASGTGAAASFVTGTVHQAWWAKGRLIAADNLIGALYNPTNTALAALPTALYTHPLGSAWTWSSCSEGTDAIYMAGYSGDKSIIYKCAVKPDGTSLDVPVVAAELPDGEIVRSVQGYLGFLLIGTDKGIRVARDVGTVLIGQLIETGTSVRCFEPQGKFAWFGWTQYSAADTGLGRLDLSTDTQGGSIPVPAYASDLMAEGYAGNVLSVVTFEGLRVFSVESVGVFAESTTGIKVGTGTVNTGSIGFGIVNRKIAVGMSVLTEPLAGSYEITLSANDGTYNSVGTESAALSSRRDFSVNETAGEEYALNIILTADNTESPCIKRAILKAVPAAPTVEAWTIPILLHETLDVDGDNVDVSPSYEKNSISALRSSGSPVTLQFGSEAISVVIKDFKFYPYSRTSDSLDWNGTLVVEARTI
jgi:hypothetical protein